ncbi:hypothetical protein PsorP6_016138 [Peronosclerospora sorghi]|uniref:Uncharacterized protein n=1 Tax=Peronosclerospora sorghi TaxID=230839 RepID=A0ACC0VLK1_9STRA|nr:hypothetical protein PsorP6_016138 [Peronosclerospora sorghi]
MGLSGLSFVVAGVQFWTTLYLETNTKDLMNEIHVAYLFVPLWVSSSAVGSSINSVATLVPIIKCKLCAYHGSWRCRMPRCVACVVRTQHFLHRCLSMADAVLWRKHPSCLLWDRYFSSTIAIAPTSILCCLRQLQLLRVRGVKLCPWLDHEFHIDPRPDFTDSNGLESGKSCNAACTYRIGFGIVLLWSLWAFFCLTCSAIESGRNYAASLTVLRHKVIAV